MLLGDLPDRGGPAHAGVGEDDVDVPLLLSYGRVEPVEVGQVRDVAPHGRDVPADPLDRPVELGLAAAGDEDVSPLGGEEPGGGQAHPAVAPGDDCDLTFELAHR